jgi:hypothetical protein
MKKFNPFYVFTISLFSLLMLTGLFSETAYAQDAPSPTPTYDPLAEPFLPENPNEFELGRNWYWHNCMTCHGDVGQGLTDEFRAIWPEDHQNCWAHGCHGGHNDDEGFPIPTIVPALVNEEKLAQFSSQGAFFEFLKSTHPPQDPGCLEDEQYQAIVKYVFNMNDRPLDVPTPEPTVISTPASTSTPEIVSEKETSSQPTLLFLVGAGIMLIVAALWLLKHKLPRT